MKKIILILMFSFMCTFALGNKKESDYVKSIITLQSYIKNEKNENFKTIMKFERAEELSNADNQGIFNDMKYIIKNVKYNKQKTKFLKNQIKVPNETGFEELGNYLYITIYPEYKNGELTITCDWGDGYDAAAGKFNEMKFKYINGELVMYEMDASGF